VTVGKLFSALFGFEYKWMMAIGAVFVIAYTFLGGFMAESISDFLQAIVMFVALIAVLGFGIFAAGGVETVAANISSIPGFVDFFGMAAPVTQDVGGVATQVVENGVPLFGESTPYALLTILSTMSWGLGYFGMPQVLLRFFAIRKVKEIRRSRIIAIVWCVISLAVAVCIGLMGRSLFPTAHLTSGGAENIFITFATFLFHPIVAGIVMSGILAAAMSSSDSYLLIAASAVSKNVFKGLIYKKATEKQIMLVTRIALAAIAIIGIIIALDENSVIFNIVSFAWAGFGATFGPIMLFSLFWKRTNTAGAVAGMLSGGITVFVWKLVVREYCVDWGLSFLNIYELLPAFLLSCLFIVVVSLITKRPSKAIEEEFELAKTIEME
jgi:sodium/proline symporter